jgi:adenosine kinase
LLLAPNSTVFVGCVGADQFAKILEEEATKAGLLVRYQVDKSTSTGACAVLVNNEHR